MNRMQKIAWFNLIVVSLALGLSVVAFSIGYFIFGLPARQAAGGFGFIGIMGFSGLSPVLFRKDKSKVQFDERDTAIQRKAVDRRLRNLLGFIRRGGDDSVVHHRAERHYHDQLSSVDGIWRDVRCDAPAIDSNSQRIRLERKRQ